MITWRAGSAAVVALAVAGTACGNDGDGDGPTASIVVFAAASLTDAFTEIGEAFTTAEPTAEVTFNFAASSQLAAQIEEGAPADVYASADVRTMDRVVEAGATGGDPLVFATNRPVIVVEPGNPLGIEELADLADPDTIVVTCAPEVPCGAYAAEVFENAGVEVRADSQEANVRAVVTKVALGEADAGIAYATDVPAADGDVDGVVIPDEVNVLAEYPVVVTADAAPGADAFVDFVLADDGRRILEEFGFSVP